MRPRFSLRWLLILTALVAAVCGWVVRPTVVANRFAATLHAKDYAAARAMCTFSETGSRPSTRDRFEVLLVQARTSALGLMVAAHKAPRTWGDVLRGRIPIRIQLELAAPSPSGYHMEVSTLYGYATMNNILVLHFTKGVDQVRHWYSPTD
jgi:hypothetical protein